MRRPTSIQNVNNKLRSVSEKACVPYASFQRRGSRRNTESTYRYSSLLAATPRWARRMRAIASSPRGLSKPSTTRVAIRSEGIRRSSGDEPGLTAGVISTDNLGFLGDSLQLSWETLVLGDETASLSLLLADPATGLALGPNYFVGVVDSQSGSISFDLANAPLPVFDLILLAVQTSVKQQPESLLSLTDIKIDGVSVADNFSVTPIPLPPALWLFASALLGLIFTRRRRRCRPAPTNF